MNERFIRWFMAFNIWLLRVSGGRLGRQLGTQRVLLLHTVGRKSGLERVTPLAHFERNGQYVIVASNWGRPEQADWYLNLKQTARAALEIDGKSLAVSARDAEGEEYDRLWRFVTEQHQAYLDHQARAVRRIPIVIFEAES